MGGQSVVRFKFVPHCVQRLQRRKFRTLFSVSLANILLLLLWRSLCFNVNLMKSFCGARVIRGVTNDLVITGAISVRTGQTQLLYVLINYTNVLPIYINTSHLSNVLVSRVIPIPGTQAG